MSDKLAKIQQIIDDHQTIRGQVKLVGDSISEQEALHFLERIHADWIPGRVEILSEK